jgi:hypothetical protein
MIDSKDLLKGGAVVGGIVAIAALGFAAGFLVARNPQSLRRFARAVAGGLERLQVAMAETREEVADLWAEVRAEARADVEEAAFARAAAATAAAAAAAAAEVERAEKAETPLAEEPAEPRKTAQRAARHRAPHRRAAAPTH